MSGTRVTWLNRLGERTEHNFGYRVAYTYAADWFRRSILECQPTWRLSVDERRASKLELIEVLNFEPRANQ